MTADLISLNGGDLEHHIHKKSFSIKTSRKDGLLIQIHNTMLDRRGKKKCYRFVNVTFNETSEQIAASDQAGHIFIVDFLSLKFWKLNTVGYCSTLSYSTYRKNELLIGKDDGAVQLINTDTSAITGTLIGHKIMVNWISFTTEYPYCLTATTDEALIWNLKTNVLVHQLTLHTTIKLKQVTFIPTSNDIFASYIDDTIQIWKFGTFESVVQISPDRWENHLLNATAFSKNGEALVVGGQTSKLFVISLKSWKVKRTVNLPDKTVGIKQLEFLSQPYDGGKNKILLALTNTGTVHFVDVINGDVLWSVDLENVCLSKLKCSENGKYTVFVLYTGELNIYSTERLFPKLSSIILSDGKMKCKKDVKFGPKKYHEMCTKEVFDIKYRGISGKSKKAFEPLKFRQTSIFLQNKLKNQISCTLRIDRLRLILKEFGEYPENYRLLIWRNILKLPNNKLAFEALVNKGTHVVSHTLADMYPLVNKSLLTNLKRLISCLAHWSPLFSQVSYLPLFVFPFVKALRNDPLACFEVVATVIVNWCQRWFEFFPFPPVNILSIVENVLCEWDKELLQWLTDHQITSHVYAWPLLETAFSEVFTGQEWLRLFDNILSNEPSFMIFAVVSYNIMCRSTLLSLTELKDFELFFKNQTAIDMTRFIRTIYYMDLETKEDSHPRKYLKPFTPLTRGDTYQAFNDYPRFVIDRQAERTNEMRLEELELLKEQARLANARLEQEKEHENVVRKQMENNQLRDLESRYKEELNKEEERLAEHRRKVMNMKKELKQRERQLLDDTREMILQQNAEKRKSELEALLKDIDRKRIQHETDMKEAEEELREHYESLINQKKHLQFQLEVGEGIKSYPPPQHKSLQEQQEHLVREIKKMKEKAALLHRGKNQELSNKIAAAEDLLQIVECQLAEEMAERQNTLFAGQKNVEVLKLQKEAAAVEKEVETLLERLVDQKLQESREKRRILKDSVTDRKILLNEQQDVAQSVADVVIRPSEVHDGSISTSSSSSSYLCSDTSGNHQNQNDPLTSGYSRREILTLPKRTTAGSHQLYASQADDFLCRSGEFYRREQQTIKSCMELRQKLLDNRR